MIFNIFAALNALLPAELYNDTKKKLHALPRAVQDLINVPNKSPEQMGALARFVKQAFGNTDDGKHVWQYIIDNHYNTNGYCTSTDDVLNYFDDVDSVTTVPGVDLFNQISSQIDTPLNDDHEYLKYVSGFKTMKSVIDSRHVARPDAAHSVNLVDNLPGYIGMNETPAKAYQMRLAYLHVFGPSVKCCDCQSYYQPQPGTNLFSKATYDLIINGKLTHDIHPSECDVCDTNEYVDGMGLSQFFTDADDAQIDECIAEAERAAATIQIKQLLGVF